MQWLKENGLVRFCDNFSQEGLDGNGLLELTKVDLIRFGIHVWIIIAYNPRFIICRWFSQNPQDQELVMKCLDALRQVGGHFSSYLSISYNYIPLHHAFQESKKSGPPPTPFPKVNDNANVWDVTEVSDWLAHEELGLYCSLFNKRKINGTALIRLEDEDLVLLGVKVWFIRIFIVEN